MPEPRSRKEARRTVRIIAAGRPGVSPEGNAGNTDGAPKPKSSTADSRLPSRGANRSQVNQALASASCRAVPRNFQRILSLLRPEIRMCKARSVGAWSLSLRERRQTGIRPISGPVLPAFSESFARIEDTEVLRQSKNRGKEGKPLRTFATPNKPLPSAARTFRVSPNNNQGRMACQQQNCNRRRFFLCRISWTK